jgi:hypothetical protein
MRRPFSLLFGYSVWRAPPSQQIFSEVATAVSSATSTALALPTQALDAQLFDEDEL